MNSDFSGNFILVVFFLFIIAGIVAFIFLAKKSADRAKESENVVNQILSQVPSDKQSLFMMQYQNVKKNPTTGVLLALFLGNIGAHKFYMNKVGAGIVYLLFCWTFIPGIIAFIEAFAISGSVGEYNEKKAREIAVLF
jgi:TM2 domain-containing membrane protein YozV